MSQVAVMRHESRAIIRVLHAHEIRAQINPLTSYQTERANIYVLDIATGQRLRDVASLEREINESLTHATGKSDGIRILYNPIAISVPRRDPVNVPLRALLESVKRIKPDADAIPLRLGRYNEHRLINNRQRRAKWLSINLADPDTPHMLVAGTTGSGKTTVIKGALLSLAVAVDPSRIGIIIIDPKGGFNGFEALPHTCAVVTDEAQAAQTLTWVVDEMKRRAAQVTQGARLLVVIDEVSLLIEYIDARNANKKNKGEAARLIGAIAKAGRGVGIHLLLGTQHPSASEMTGGMLANVPVRAVGKVARKEDGKTATGIAGREIMAHKLTGRGDFLLAINSNEDNTFPFQAAYIADGDDLRVIDAICNEWWGNQRSPIVVDLTRIAMTPDVQPADQQGALTIDGYAYEMLETHAPVIDEVSSYNDDSDVVTADITDLTVRNALASLDALWARSETPATISKSRAMERESRYTFVRVAIREHYRKEGGWPSQGAISKLYQGEYGVVLNNRTARKLLIEVQESEKRAVEGVESE